MIDFYIFTLSCWVFLDTSATNIAVVNYQSLDWEYPSNDLSLLTTAAMEAAWEAAKTLTPLLG